MLLFWSFISFCLVSLGLSCCAITCFICFVLFYSNLMQVLGIFLCFGCWFDLLFFVFLLTFFFKYFCYGLIDLFSFFCVCNIYIHIYFYYSYFFFGGGRFDAFIFFFGCFYIHAKMTEFFLLDFRGNLESLLDQCKLRAQEVSSRLSVIDKYETVVKDVRDRIRDLAISSIAKVRAERGRDRQTKGEK